MTVAITSIVAYHKIKPELGARQQTVLDALSELGRASNQDLADYLRWEINKITPRSNELVKMGKMEADGIKMGRFGHSVKVWKVTPIQTSLLNEQDCEG